MNKIRIPVRSCTLCGDFWLGESSTLPWSEATSTLSSRANRSWHLSERGAVNESSACSTFPIEVLHSRFQAIGVRSTGTASRPDLKKVRSFCRPLLPGLACLERRCLQRLRPWAKRTLNRHWRCPVNERHGRAPGATGVAHLKTVFSGSVSRFRCLSLGLNTGSDRDLG